MRFKEIKEAYEDNVWNNFLSGGGAGDLLKSFGNDTASLLKKFPMLKGIIKDKQDDPEMDSDEPITYPNDPTNPTTRNNSANGKIAMPSVANKGAASSASAISSQPMRGGSTGEIKPVQGSVNSNFGANRGNRSHPGVDIKAMSGTPIRAPITGQVTQAFMTNNDCGGTIAVSNGSVQHRFCHCSKINVSVGQYVKQGDVVGLTGGGPGDVGRGHSSGPHLHWEKKLASGGLVNPMA
jgi:murein DD-endopeptidase MepM/ murein hydrolase activator NlpD